MEDPQNPVPGMTITSPQKNIAPRRIIKTSTLAGLPLVIYEAEGRQHQCFIPAWRAWCRRVKGEVAEAAK